MMGDNQSRVIYTGIRAASEREAAEVLELVGAKLGLNRKRTLALLGERPAVVAEKLPERQAARVAQQLAALGLQVAVWPQALAPAEPEVEFLSLPDDDLLELEIPASAVTLADAEDEWLDEIPGSGVQAPAPEVETASGKDKLDAIMRELLKTEAAPAHEAEATVSDEEASRFWPLLAQMRDKVSAKDRAVILKQILRMGGGAREVVIQEAELTAEPTVLLLDEPALAPDAMALLARMGEVGAAALARELVRRSQKHEGVEAYIELASQAGGPGVEALSRALRDETERVQELMKTAERLDYENQREAAKQHEAGQGAGKTRVMLDRERQIVEMQQEMEVVHTNRFTIVKALGRVRSDAVVVPLIGVLQDPQEQIRTLAAKALIVLGPAAIPQLVHELKPSYISTAEADILVEIGPAAAAYLVESMKHTTWTLEQDTLFRIGKPAVEPLLGVFDDPDPAVRLKAISVLGRIADARAVPRLIELLQAPDTPLEHRPRVLWALGRIGDSRAVEPIIDAMQHPELRTDAIKALHRMGTPTVEAIRKLGPRVLAPFIDGLDDYALRPIAEEFLTQLGELAYEPVAAALEREELRIPAIEILGRLGDQRAAERLLRFAGDENLDVRRAALEALGKLQVKEALEPLLAGLHDPEVAAAAAGALGHLRDPRAVPDLVLCLTDQQEDLPKKAAEALGHIGSPEAIEPLIKAVGVEHTRWAALVAVARLGEASREAMRQKGAPMVEALISHLKRAKTLGHLGRINGPEVRGAIVDFIVGFGPMALELLLKEFKKDEGIAEAVGRIRSPDTYQFLMTALLSDDPELHKQAAIALGWFGQRSVIPALVRLLETEGREVESLKIFAESVMRLDSGTAIPELVKLLAASHKKETVEAIEKILTAQPDVVLPHLLESLKEERAETVFQTELHILELFGTRAVEPLLQAIRETYFPDNKRRIIQALARVGGDRAVGELIAQLPDPDDSVAIEAVRALEKLCVRQALPSLYELRERLGRDEPVLDHAIVTLQQWGI